MAIYKGSPHILVIFDPLPLSTPVHIWLTLSPLSVRTQILNMIPNFQQKFDSKYPLPPVPLYKYQESKLQN